MKAVNLEFISDLKTRFNVGVGHPHLVVIFSPT
jgi:hypothetical protein